VDASLKTTIQSAQEKSHPKVAFAISSKTDYLLAASEAGAAASEATEAASTAAEAATGAASTAGASFLPQATRAAAANKDANRIDLFM
jgi:hypothetical protein